MRQLKIFAFLILSISFVGTSCSKKSSERPTTQNPSENNGTDTTVSRIRLTIGQTSFTATLVNNTSAHAFKAMLPLTLNMSELNGNEKFYYFSGTLPTNATSTPALNSGDVVLYGNNCLVLFYENLSSSINYTRIGRIDNPAGLATAVGSGNVTVTYTLQ